MRARPFQRTFEMTRFQITTAAIAIAISVPFAALAASDTPTAGQMPISHGAMAGMAGSGDDGPASRAFEEANGRMHADMAIVYTGDTDADFVRGMTPHHQGAIDMARIELEFGKDPEIRKLAEDIIKAQEAEIALMQTWLKAHGN
jgi:uncharacterized protein (DUF305 family)